jgi:3-methyladenine DNA glycosylase AlkC
MMNLLTERIEGQIQKDLMENFISGKYLKGVENIRAVLDCMYTAIPTKKRISHGRYTTIKVLAEKLFEEFKNADLPVVQVGATILNSTDDHRTTGVGLGILALHGIEDHQSVLPFFERAAQADNWEPREYAQGLFRKIVKAHPVAMRSHLLEYVQSTNPNLRRFVSEMLRPVLENKWLYNDIEYSLSLLRYLFKEAHPYPKSSVGNNLSDISHRNPEIIFQLVAELVSMDDENSHWIATRACRNLVKKYPIRVMDALGIDEYKYKNRIYKRIDFASAITIKDEQPNNTGSSGYIACGSALLKRTVGPLNSKPDLKIHSNKNGNDRDC